MCAHPTFGTTALSCAVDTLERGMHNQTPNAREEGDEKMKNKICPLIHAALSVNKASLYPYVQSKYHNCGSCLGCECALWNASDDVCCIASFARYLAGMAVAVNDMKPVALEPVEVNPNEGD